MKTKILTMLLVMIFSFSVNAHESICVTQKELDENYSKQKPVEPEYLVYTYNQLNANDANHLNATHANHVGRKYIKMYGTCMDMPKNECKENEIPLFYE